MPIAKIPFICSQCGKEYIRRFTANTGRDAMWMKENLSGDSSRLCPDCYAAEQKRKNEELLHRVLTANGLVLAELSGSAKQIAWAEKLRAQKLTFLSTYSVPTQNELLQKMCVQFLLLSARAWRTKLLPKPSSKMKKISVIRASNDF